MESSAQSVVQEVGGGESLALSRLTKSDLTVHLALHPDKRELARRLGLPLCTVASYYVHKHSLKLHDEPMPRGKGVADLNFAYAYENVPTDPIGQHIHDEKQRAAYAFSVFSAIVREKMVGRVEIDLSNCTALELCVFSESLYLACGSHPSRKFHTIIFTSSTSLECTLDHVNWARTLGEVLPGVPLFLADCECSMCGLLHDPSWSGGVHSATDDQRTIHSKEALIQDGLSGTHTVPLQFDVRGMKQFAAILHDFINNLRRADQNPQLELVDDGATAVFTLSGEDGRSVCYRVRIAASVSEIACWQKETAVTGEQAKDVSPGHDWNELGGGMCSLSLYHPPSTIISGSLCASSDTCSEFEVLARNDRDTDEEDTISVASTPTVDDEVEIAIVEEEIDKTGTEDNQDEASRQEEGETADTQEGMVEESLEEEDGSKDLADSAAGLNPYELCFFADISGKHRAAVASLGGEQKDVVIYTIHTQHVWMSERVAEWSDRAQKNAFQVGRHITTAESKRELAFSIFTRLLSSPSVRCFEIDIRKCSVDMVLHFVDVLSLCLSSPQHTLPLVILKEAEGEKLIKCEGDEAARWREAIRKLGEVLPCRELCVMLECACGKCTFIGDTLYAHWKGVSVLESIAGRVRTKFDWFDGRFPLLFSFADHSVCEGEEAERQLNLLAVAQRHMQAWRSDGRSFFFAVRSAVSFTLLRDDPRFTRLLAFLQPFQKDTRIQGDWRGVSHSREYRFSRSEGCLSVTLSIHPSLLSVEVFPADMGGHQRRLVWN